MFLSEFVGWAPFQPGAGVLGCEYLGSALLQLTHAGRGWPHGHPGPAPTQKGRMDNERVLRTAVEAAGSLGAQYAEARYGRKHRMSVSFDSGKITGSGEQTSEGWGIRVLVDGYWGFAAAPGIRNSDVDSLLAAAVDLANAARTVGGGRAELAPVSPTTTEHLAIGESDPFQVPFAAIQALIEAIHSEMVGSPSFSGSRGMLDFHRDVMELITSEGTTITQHIGVVGGGYVATADDGERTARRTFPHHGGKDYAAAGFEWFQRMGFVDNAKRTAAEAASLLGGVPCPRMERSTVVLDPAMVGTVLHETVGHATELDRMIGEERDNFGSSFATPEDIGTFPYASPTVSVNADATYPLAAGSYGFDAEGVAAQSLPVIENGVLVGAMNSRESAAVIGATPAGTGRAVDWTRIPMARMTNMVLLPGEGSTQDLIAGVDDGLYIRGDMTTDIDDNREMCAFGGEIGWRIRRGELAEVVERPIIFADSHQLLRQVDRVAGPDESWVTGILGCGKGQPWQFVFSGQGGPPARFRNVEVGLPEGDA